MCFFIFLMVNLMLIGRVLKEKKMIGKRKKN